MQLFGYFGYILLGRARETKDILLIIASSLVSAGRRFGKGRPANMSVFYKQVYFTGFEAIPIISWLAVILGIVIVTQALNILPLVGGEGIIGEILVWVLVREAGPLFASVIVIARSGTAIASELGSMKISRETLALQVMGIDIAEYLIAPRVIGTAVSVFVLTFYFEGISVLGGYLLAGFGKSIAFSTYIESILSAMGLLEVGVSLLKSVLFGLIIGSVCSYHGLNVTGSITQIPQKTTKAVMGSLSLIFVLNALLTFLFYF
jgi:phospholipid/cholesterol/gamma-HCH transport system permease protein